MADTSDKDSEVVVVDKPVDSSEAEVTPGGNHGERSVHQWATTRWELWLFYVYYIVRHITQATVIRS